MHNKHKVLHMIRIWIFNAAVLGVTNKRIDSIFDATEYLNRFGYLNNNSSAELSSLFVYEATIEEGIKSFQRIAGLNQSGNLDNMTLKMMNLPRCGVQDVPMTSDEQKLGRYKLIGSRWPKLDLTYRVVKYSQVIGKENVDFAVQNAFKAWSDNSRLRFKRVDRGSADIQISFGKYRHGDRFPFDGKGGALAHAFFPMYGGDAHFDDSEKWTMNSFDGTNLLQTAIHEFGHSLGLGHSEVKKSIMTPFYKGSMENPRLHSDDIKAIQRLYGSNTDSATPSSTSTPPLRLPRSLNLCYNPSVDAITTIGQEVYVFKGKYVYKLSGHAVADGYPKRIRSEFRGLPNDIDAALAWTNGSTYFFKRSKYWEMQDGKLLRGFPKSTRRYFRGFPNSIDAAFTWKEGRKSQMIIKKGDKYWTYENDTIKPTTGWKGIPKNIEAAFTFKNGFTYFFKGEEYYRSDNRRRQMGRANPNFPRETLKWWFECSS